MLDNATGSIYVVGQFQGMVNFDPGGAPLTLTSSDTTASDAYIVELPPGGDGALAVVKSFGNGMGGPAFNGLTLSAAGGGDTIQATADGLAAGTSPPFAPLARERPPKAGIQLRWTVAGRRS